MLNIHVFFLSPTLKSTFKQLGKAISGNVSTQEGGLATATKAYENSDSPDLVIIELVEDPTIALESLTTMASHCKENTSVIVLRQDDDLELYNQLIQMGVSECIIGEVTVDILKEKISAIYSTVNQSFNHVTGVAFLGANGGSGASTMAQLFAWMYTQHLNKRAILVDLDLAFGTVGRNLGLKNITAGVAEALIAGTNLRSQAFQPLLTQIRDKLFILPAPRDLAQSYDIPDDLIPNFLDICYQESPMVIFDVPRVWCSWMQALLLRTNHVVIVTEPTYENVKEAAKMADTLSQALDDNVTYHIIVNKNKVPKRTELKPEKIAIHFPNLPIIYSNWDASVMQKTEGANRPIEELFGQANFKKTMANLSQSILQIDPAEIHASNQSKSSIMPNQGGSQGSLKNKLYNIIFETD